MIENVEGVETELKIGPLPSLEETDILIESDIGFVHAADSDVAPAGRIGADKISEVLVDAVLDGIARRGFIVIAREVLDAGPSRNRGKVRVLVWEREELAGVKPLVERLLIMRKSRVFAREKRVGAEYHRRAGLNRILPRELPTSDNRVYEPGDGAPKAPPRAQGIVMAGDAAQKRVGIKQLVEGYILAREDGSRESLLAGAWNEWTRRILRALQAERIGNQLIP